MPGIFEDAAAAAKRAAEEAAERLREMRRNALRKEIDDWNGKLSEVKEQISGLETEKKNLATYLAEWEEAKRTYNNNDILSEVVVINLFEGVCADNIKDDFTEIVTDMDRRYDVAGGMENNISVQITKLRQYESVIQSKLTSLRNELNSI